MIITIEAIAIVSGLVNLVNGAVAGLLGIVVAVVVISVLMSEDAVEWYRHGLTSVNGTADRHA